jgi:hypothetical protein
VGFGVAGCHLVIATQHVNGPSTAKYGYLNKKERRFAIRLLAAHLLRKFLTVCHEAEASECVREQLVKPLLAKRALPAFLVPSSSEI